jgi:hypothetical protein
MKLCAAPLDFVVVRLDVGGDSVGVSDTTATLETDHGAELPAIPSGKWLPLLAVPCLDPNQVTLDEFRGGDWLQVTDVTGDAITFRRTGSAREIAAGEYLFLSLSSYLVDVLTQKLEDVEAYVARIKGGYDGIPRYGADGAPDELKVIPDSPASMRVAVSPGVALVSSEVLRLRALSYTPTLTAPVTQNRIDLVQAFLGTESRLDYCAVKQGAESATPSAPSVDSGAIGLATILLTPSHTTIQAADITDIRVRR